MSDNILDNKYFTITMALFGFGYGICSLLSIERMSLFGNILNGLLSALFLGCFWITRKNLEVKI